MLDPFTTASRFRHTDSATLLLGGHEETPRSEAHMPQVRLTMFLLFSGTVA